MRPLLVLALSLATASCNAVLGLSDPTIAPAQDASDTDVTTDSAMLSDDGTDSDSAVVVDSTETDSAIATDADAACMPPYRDVVAIDQPLHYWRLNESSGTSAADEGYAATKLPATYEGSIVLDSPGALVCTPEAKAARMAATGGIIRVDGTPSFAESLPFSVEFWAKPETVSPTERFLVGRVGAGGYWFTSSSTGVKFLRKEAGTVDTVASAAPIAAGEWHHIVGVYTGTAMILYVDGVSATRTAPLKNVAAALTFSVATPAAALVAVSETLGVFDEVAIYDKELPSVRVDAHYRTGRGL